MTSVAGSPITNPSKLITAILSTLEHQIIPLTTQGVSSGSKVFGAAILSKTTLAPLTVATNNESLSPLLHGEINCIQQFFTVEFPIPSNRPDPRSDCIFFATHEPCSLCLSGIAWSGFKELYYLFTYEDSRDLFSIPYDIEIQQEVFRVRAEEESDESLEKRELYNRKNKFFEGRSLAEVVAEIEDEGEKTRLNGQITRLRELYGKLSETYQTGKKKGMETSSVWK
ncbi:hypothetical protein N0V94_002491 [Neodidymelliopsis sp. IMI 364377]|nr:hypothetical protein N0V94_002491 [Neodidymelliopsis sp. IMI 364377]